MWQHYEEQSPTEQETQNDNTRVLNKPLGKPNNFGYEKTNNFDSAQTDQDRAVHKHRRPIQQLKSQWFLPGGLKNEPRHTRGKDRTHIFQVTSNEYV